MKQKCKKLLSVFLSIVMLLSITAGIDLSAYAETSGDFNYTVLDDGTAKISRYTGSADDLTIPSEIDGYTVTSVGDWAFFDCTSLTSVTIGNSVTSIGEYAFFGCTSLISVTIGNNVTSIGECAFICCASLTSLTIPNSVTSIGGWAFSECTCLKNVTIPNSVTSIGDGAFRYCTSLISITVDSGNADYSSKDGVLFNKTKTVLIQYPIGNSIPTYDIPNSVTIIGGWAFSECKSLTNVTIPDSVTNITYDAFSHCTSLTSITIPNSVTSIGDDAFKDCTSLTSITIPNSVTSIGDVAFYDCTSLTDVYYSGSQEQWNNISIGSENDYLTNANIHYNYIPPCNVHTPANPVKENVKKATCTTAGSYDSVVYCSVCKHELNRTKKTIAKFGHNYKTTTTKATQTADGKIVKKCLKCNHIASTTVIPKVSSITISTTKYTYDGNYKEPSVTIKDRKGNKLSTSNYTVAYSNNKYVGKASVKVTLKGNYSGTKTLYFTINPKGTTLSTLTATSKGFKVTWKKQATQTTGYQIQYATNSKFDNAKLYTISKNTTTSKTFTKLSAKKKYYVRVRTYKVVNGKKYYSAWSKSKSVTTKS